ncbi:phage portal protein [Gordonia sp. PP30]|uniref:phage portal protein n=1 Tax=Gordonia sp. PP30 TaxID=2935861 RepID=UPI001FFFB918|nr:phage portal protein [Gordonia sp. PP30]UQE74200.1 phage portal protein [Gordonia sp. PP30]
MNLLDRIAGGRRPERSGMNLDEYVKLLNQSALNSGYMQPALQQTMSGEATERPPATFEGMARNAYAANGVVFACMLVRQLVFSSVRFTYQRLRDNRPADLFGTPALRILERPWNGGTTQDMLSRMIQDADLQGNSFWVRDHDELVRLRPDWVEVVGMPRFMSASERTGRALTNRGGQVGWKKVGYIYTEGGIGCGSDPAFFLADEVVHYAPIPDPLARFTGMSWLTPIIREIQADESMTKHQRKFFDNAATPNMVVKHDPLASMEKIKKFAELLEDTAAGVDNAWKTLNLYPGADVTLVGANLRDIDFKNVRGGGETRIAAAAGVPPVIVGLSEGLAAATYSNYGQARRRLADGTAHPLWQNLASCLEHAAPPPGPDTRLWYDAADVPFLREDEKDAAEIQKTRAETISNLITAGYVPDSVVKAVDAGDFRMLQHSGLMSVQLTAPGADGSNRGSDPDEVAKRANAAGILVRSGFDPDDSRDTAGLPADLKHLGLLPVTVQNPNAPHQPPSEEGPHDEASPAI